MIDIYIQNFYVNGIFARLTLNQFLHIFVPFTTREQKKKKMQAKTQKVQQFMFSDEQVNVISVAFL